MGSVDNVWLSAVMKKWDPAYRGIAAESDRNLGMKIAVLD
jgi:hypothetical protein